MAVLGCRLIGLTTRAAPTQKLIGGWRSTADGGRGRRSDGRAARQAQFEVYDYGKSRRRYTTRRRTRRAVVALKSRVSGRRAHPEIESKKERSSAPTVRLGRRVVQGRAGRGRIRRDGPEGPPALARPLRAGGEGVNDGRRSGRPKAPAVSPLFVGRILQEALRGRVACAFQSDRCTDLERRDYPVRRRRPGSPHTQ